MQRLRAAFVVNRLGPYHSARIRALADYCDILVVELFRRDATYLWLPVDIKGVNRITLYEKEGAVDEELAVLEDRFSGIIRDFRPNVVVVPGWSSISSLAAVCASMAQSVPLVYLVDSHRSRSYLRPFIGVILDCADAIFAAGTAHIAFLRSLGVKRGRIFSGYDVVDNEHFSRLRRQVERRPDPVAVARPVLLCVARFVSEKNLERLIEGFLASKASRGFTLRICGDGPIRPILTKLAACAPEGSVIVDRFLHYDELPTAYANAAALILPSVSETWGLVVNEAMAAGLPVIVSKECGCCQDLVREGENGTVFDPWDTGEIGAAIDRVLLGGELERMGDASKKLIGEWGLEFHVSQALAAMNCAVTHWRPRSRLRIMFVRGVARLRYQRGLSRIRP